MSEERGPGWVWGPARKLDVLAAEVARDWNVPLGPRFPMARYSFAGPAGDGVVLKVVPVEDDEADLEGDALAAWAGDGAVRLLRHDRSRRALLIERCVPGTDASTSPMRTQSRSRSLSGDDCGARAGTAVSRRRATGCPSGSRRPLVTIIRSSGLHSIASTG